MVKGVLGLILKSAIGVKVSSPVGTNGIAFIIYQIHCLYLLVAAMRSHTAIFHLLSPTATGLMQLLCFSLHLAALLALFSNSMQFSFKDVSLLSN